MSPDPGPHALRAFRAIALQGERIYELPVLRFDAVAEALSVRGEVIRKGLLVRGAPRR